MQLVVIESPYAGDVERNTRYLKDCIKDSLDRGEAPFASHLFYTQVLDDTDPEQRKLGMEAGFAWGAHANLVAVYIDLPCTEGMDRGIERALANGTPIVYRSLPTCAKK